MGELRTSIGNRDSTGTAVDTLRVPHRQSQISAICSRLKNLRIGVSKTISWGWMGDCPIGSNHQGNQIRGCNVTVKCDRRSGKSEARLRLFLLDERRHGLSLDGITRQLEYV